MYFKALHYSACKGVTEDFYPGLSLRGSIHVFIHKEVYKHKKSINICAKMLPMYNYCRNFEYETSALG